MATERATASYDQTLQLAEAIRLLAERVTPKSLDPRAQDAVRAYNEIARSLRTVFGGTPDAPPTPPPTKY